VSICSTKGSAPERILLLTFTRRSAREILNRVRAIRATAHVHHVAGGTFHSVAHHTLVDITRPWV